MISESATAAFYKTPRGLIAARVLREQILALWPDLSGCAVLGLGWTAPYLRLWRNKAERVIEAVPHETASETGCIVAEDRLPFPDLMFDRILLVHAVEQADVAPRLLREVWRVLRDDGRLLVLTPNRLGLWAHAESTPFGHGQPFSPGQIDRLLTRAAFRTRRQAAALYTPPMPARLVLRSYRAWEAAGARLVPQLAGVTLTEAEKDAFAAVPLRAGQRRRVILPEPA